MSEENKNEKLEKLYEAAAQADFDVFAEQRSNILLISGEHYTKRKRKYYVNRIRDSRSITDDQKLRLTKNHVNKIVQSYINIITTNSPGVTIVPDNDSELQDQKAAELNKAVWEDIKDKHKFSKKIREFAEDFVGIGECAVKIFWNPQKGKVIGQKPVEEAGPMHESTYNDGTEDTLPKTDPKMMNIFEGDFEFERIFGFNLLRDPGAKSWEESPYVIIRKMVKIDKLKSQYKDDPDKLKFIQAEKDDTYVVFEGKNGSYNTSKNEALIQEIYYRSCAEYPNGYYYIKTRHGILEKGELPFGIFPIVFQGFQSFQTSPRGRSIIKQLRPYQVEINRTASAIATHQITVGDDKLVINTAGKVEQGAALPGVRVIKTNGFGSPTVIPGRTGEQYLPYLESQIREMYQTASLDEMEVSKAMESANPMVLLMRSLKQKQKFSLYLEKFEEFLVEVVKTCLGLAKHYYEDNKLIPAIGRREYINISEFRSIEDIGYRIKVKPQAEDIESNMGKQLVMNHVLQYASGQLTPEQIGKLIRTMPFANAEETFSDLTIDYDNAKNMILQLDRGEVPLLNKYDNHQYMIQKITHRMRQADYNFLDDSIQANYQNVLTEYENMATQQAQEIQRAQSGFIPTGGYMVKADFYVEEEDGKLKRATIPYEAMNWLLEKLNEQGMSQKSLEEMSQGVQADIASQMNNQGAQTPAGSDMQNVLPIQGGNK